MPRETIKREGEGIEIESSSRRHCKGVLFGNVLENREGRGQNTSRERIRWVWRLRRECVVEEGGV